MGAAPGIAVALLGLWLVLRTIVKDSNGQTLVDRLLSL